MLERQVHHMAQAKARVAVTVSFLRMDRRPAPGLCGLTLPPDTTLVRLDHCTVAFYRYLYNTVGAPYVWWLRRTLSDPIIAAILAEPDVSIHVLYQGGEPAGFFEIDRRAYPVANLGYFGLLPHAVGRGMGPAFLAAAVDEAWAGGPRALTVNTCTADHPRALPGYLRAGFQVVRRVEEIWEVPANLGLSIPAHLLV